MNTTFLGLISFGICIDYFHSHIQKHCKIRFFHCNPCKHHVYIGLYLSTASIGYIESKLNQIHPLVVRLIQGQFFLSSEMRSVIRPKVRPEVRPDVTHEQTGNRPFLVD